jgi:hypothetical protein
MLLILRLLACDGIFTSHSYDRMVGALKNLGRKQVICWKDFIRSHVEVLVGTDFFTVEVLTLIDRPMCTHSWAM